MNKNINLGLAALSFIAVLSHEAKAEIKPSGFANVHRLISILGDAATDRLGLPEFEALMREHGIALSDTRCLEDSPYSTHSTSLLPDTFGLFAQFWDNEPFQHASFYVSDPLANWDEILALVTRVFPEHTLAEEFTVEGEFWAIRLHSAGLEGYLAYVSLVLPDDIEVSSTAFCSGATLSEGDIQISIELDGY